MTGNQQSQNVTWVRTLYSYVYTPLKITYELSSLADPGQTIGRIGTHLAVPAVRYFAGDTAANIVSYGFEAGSFIANPYTYSVRTAMQVAAVQIASATTQQLELGPEARDFVNLAALEGASYAAPYVQDSVAERIKQVVTALPPAQGQPPRNPDLTINKHPRLKFKGKEDIFNTVTKSVNLLRVKRKLTHTLSESADAHLFAQSQPRWQRNFANSEQPALKAPRRCEVEPANDRQTEKADHSIDPLVTQCPLFDVQNPQSISGTIATMDFSTLPNTAIFYSGPGNQTAAFNYAQKHGGMTMEMTVGGYCVNQNDFYTYFPLDIANELWGQASALYAQGVVGVVTLFVDGALADRIYKMYEEPALINNPNITAVFSCNLDLECVEVNFTDQGPSPITSQGNYPTMYFY